MTLSSRETDELRGLLARLSDAPMAQRDAERLNELLAADAEARQMFADYAILDACLEMVWTSGEGQLLETPPPVEPEAVDGSLPIIIDGTPPLHSPLFALVHGGGFLFSYAAAVVIVGIGLLIGWAYQVSTPHSDHRESVRVAPQHKPADVGTEPDMVFVGRVTDMVECQWADQTMGTVDYAYVPLHRKYALASGLMEITYDSGAKVILQGPCVYEVESGAGGYLSRGRLTARVEKRGETRAERDATDRQSTIGNLRSSSPLSPLPSTLFTVRTPTAKVTDLGTEFAVEVDPSGVSTAHVYEGKVELLAIADGKTDDAKAIRLGKNESARVVVGKDHVAKVVREKARSSGFVRKMPRRMRIELFNTGLNLKPGDKDPHWQLAARSDMPKFKPQPAVVTESGDARRVASQADRSQWISAVAGDAHVPDRVLYTFRTTFDLTGMRPSTAKLNGRFVADNHVRAIRLNGHSVPVPAHGYREFGFFHAFSTNRGFVERTNVLEIDVENGEPDDVATSSMLGLLLELDGSVVSAWPEPPLNAMNTKQK
jgi:hypothetical protein